MSLIIIHFWHGKNSNHCQGRRTFNVTFTDDKVKHYSIRELEKISSHLNNLLNAQMRKLGSQKGEITPHSHRISEKAAIRTHVPGSSQDSFSSCPPNSSSIVGPPFHKLPPSICYRNCYRGWGMKAWPLSSLEHLFFLWISIENGLHFLYSCTNLKLSCTT